MHMLRNHRSFESVAGTEVADALASIVLDQSHQHAGQTRSELAAGGSHVPVFNSGSKFRFGYKETWIDQEHEQ